MSGHGVSIIFLSIALVLVALFIFCDVSMFGGWIYPSSLSLSVCVYVCAPFHYLLVSFG
jgi:hypothetical protein